MPKHVRRCRVCDDPWEGDGLCPKCEAELDRPVRIGEAVERIWTDHPPIAAFGVHVAGPLVRLPTGSTDQCCARCGGLLATTRTRGLDPVLPRYMVPGTEYDEGTLVERGPGWQAIKLSRAVPTCAAMTPEPTAA